MHPSLRLRSLLEAAAIKLLQGLLYPVPLRWASAMGAGLGWFLFTVVRLKRRSTLATLDTAFGDELGPAERRRLAARCYRHFGSLIAEFLCEPRLAGRPLDDMMAFEGLEAVDEALREGKGLVLAMGHLGSWELQGAALARRGTPFWAYAGRLHNPLADAFVNGIRRSVAIQPISKQGAMRGMLRALQGKCVLAIVADQHFSRNRYFVRFFGRPVSIAPGLASLVQHTGAPLMFAESWRVGRFRYRGRIVRIPVPPSSGNEELDLLRLSQRYFDLLEAAVRRHPEQYFWMHKRWRVPPEPGQLSETNRAFLAGEAMPSAPGAAAPGGSAAP
jgi:Kdo2-lipid IVA lauroyltransferase/acyltransferase